MSIQTIVYKQARIDNIPFYQLLLFNLLLSVYSILIYLFIKYKNNKLENNDFNKIDISLLNFKNIIKTKSFNKLILLIVIALQINVFTYILDIAIIFSLFNVLYIILLCYNIYINKPNKRNIIILILYLISFIISVLSFTYTNYDTRQIIFIIIFSLLLCLTSYIIIKQTDITKINNLNDINNFSLLDMLNLETNIKYPILLNLSKTKQKLIKQLVTIEYQHLHP